MLWIPKAPITPNSDATAFAQHWRSVSTALNKSVCLYLNSVEHYKDATPMWQGFKVK